MNEWYVVDVVVISNEGERETCFPFVPLHSLPICSYPSIEIRLRYLSIFLFWCLVLMLFVFLILIYHDEYILANPSWKANSMIIEHNLRKSGVEIASNDLVISTEVLGKGKFDLLHLLLYLLRLFLFALIIETINIYFPMYWINTGESPTFNTLWSSNLYTFSNYYYYYTIYLPIY